MEQDCKSTNSQSLKLEDILTRENLNEALKQVVANKGAPGVDGISTADIKGLLRANEGALAQALKQSVLKGKYRPKAVKRVWIPKENGSQRPLGIPTVIDRLIQQAVAQKLQEVYEPKFSNSSFGYRPNRSAQDAIERILGYANEGYDWVIDMDLEKFFDTVNHELLIYIMERDIKDRRILTLVLRMMRAPIEENGKQTPCTLGVPQGGCISPLLANILLNELDQLLESRGLRFVRYADDMMIMCHSERSAKRVLESTARFIEKRLKLNVNPEKTKVSQLISPNDLKFLGFGFWKRDGKYKSRPHKKSLKKLKTKIKEILGRSRGVSLEKYQTELTTTLRGWYNYFKIGLSNNHVQTLDKRTRRRIRMLYWKRRKKIKTKNEVLMKLGVNRQKAWEWANSSKKYWRIANSWILSTTLTNERLRKHGWLCLKDLQS